jgi:hypothetical protein
MRLFVYVRVPPIHKLLVGEHFPRGEYDQQPRYDIAVVRRRRSEIATGKRHDEEGERDDDLAQLF